MEDEDIARFVLEYDMAYLYQYCTDMFNSFWPILAVSIGLSLAALLIGAIAYMFKKYLFDE